MIFAKNITKKFGKFTALDDISFEISKGEIVAFLGQNGAGKTTLMRILTTYLPLTSGSATIFDCDIRKQAHTIKKKIGYLPENPPLYQDMSVASYLKFAARLKDVPAKHIKIQVERVLSVCNLKNVERKTIVNLSKGYKQRVGIAQAIINEPELLILDEPINGLDPTQIIQVWNLIRELECERTVIVSTHLLAEIEKISKRVMVVKSGRIVLDGAIGKVLDRPHKKVVLRLNGEKAFIEEAVKKTGFLTQTYISIEDNVCTVGLDLKEGFKNFNELIQNLLSVNVQVIEINHVKPTLEEIFLEVNG